MKNLLKTLFGGTVAAWEMLIDLPVPSFCRRLFYSPCISPSALAAGFTVVGFLIGLFIALIGGILNISWLNRYVAAALFAVAAVIISEILDSGRGLRLLISGVSLRLGGAGWIDSVLRARDRDGSFEKSTGSVAAMTVILAEIVCFGMLAYYRSALWCVAVFTGTFVIQMLFATLDRGYGEVPYINIEPEKMRDIWKLPAVIGVLTVLIFPAAGIVASAIVAGLGQMIHKNFVLTGTPVTADVITLCGKITQLVLLLCGLVFVI